ncbi:uncharacterized protein LOC110830986 isoform X3 [Zootermopsis nevadensis]|uniref:uncharacterized protein LOC110830986 isoform X3 n=1 Tax=Zootermopsis nevadensis TaxID=136037 RepID=UPI000B8E9488|nr:uncharacterized protein LOC110830986 isoform X3 [Zootermopsis nevadensis]
MAPKLLNILLQRDNSNVQWGFRISGGKDLAKPLTIVKVFPGTLASQYFVPGDIVLRIQGYNANDLLHVEAIDLIREPLKNLELLVQKSDHIPASIWGPVPVLHRPSEWIRRSKSPFADDYSEPKMEFRPVDMLRRHSVAVSQEDPIVKMAYTPTAFDSRTKQQFQPLTSAGFETTTKMPPTMYQTQVINQVSSVTQHMDNYFNQQVSTGKRPCDNNARYAKGHSQIYREVQKVNHNLQEPQGSLQITSELPQMTDNLYKPHLCTYTESPQMSHNVDLSQENITEIQIKSNNEATGIIEEQRNVKLGVSCCRNVEAYKIKHVTEKPRIQTTTDVLKRPISPEFTMFPNSKSNSLLKLVLNKSLQNYSPQDFEKIKASVTEIYDGRDEDEDSDVEEDEDDDAEGNDTSSEEPRNTSYESSLAGSGSLIFERYWMAENDEGGSSDDSELLQQRDMSCESLSRNSSRLSASSPLPDSASTPDDSRGRQSSQVSGGGNTPSPRPLSATVSGDGVTDSNNTAPSFPPPPPPPGLCSLPTVRLSTEIPDTRRGAGYEPPAAIQNAMMTKDKKPFTYTPGGLDLSQIRSPRMQRRITRNANAEGVSEQPQTTGLKTSPLVQPSPQGPLPPSALAAMQPQMAVPVFPTGGVQLQTTTAPPPPPPPPPHPGPAPVEPSPAPVIRPVQSPEPVKPKSPPVSPPVQVQNEPGSIYVPPVTSRSQVGSLYIPPINNTSQQEPVATSPQRQQTPVSPLPTLNKAPTPWISKHQRQQQQQQQQSTPSWVNREEPQQAAGTTRIIPIQVEGRNEPAQPPQLPKPQLQQQAALNQPQTRIIPIQVEGSATIANNTSSQTKQQASCQQQRKPVYVHNKFNPPSPQTPVPASPAPYNHDDNQSDQNSKQHQHQQSWGPSGGNGGPTQSRSFRVLQKITDTDNSEGESDAPVQEYGPPNSGGGQYNSQGVPAQQLRKLQLSEDDRALMNKFRAQVPRGPAVARGPQARPLSVQQTPSGDGTPQPYIPPSEQQVPEPRKYTGGAIPSRSFRMLQAMTAPENYATVSSSDGRETPASLSHQGYGGNNRGHWAHYDPGYWGPEAWWGCYPSPAPDMLENREQYWDPYSAMYAYMAEVNAAYGFPPIPYPSMYPSHHFAPLMSARYPQGGSSDLDECSGYSSTEEMPYYGANFAHGMAPVMNDQCGTVMSTCGLPAPPPAMPSIMVTQTPNSEGSLGKVNASGFKSSDRVVNANSKEVNVEEGNSPRQKTDVSRPSSSVDLDVYETAESEKCSDDEQVTTDSDTEVEEDKDNKDGIGSGQLQTIRSVSDINVYKDTMDSEEHDSEEETDDGEEEEEEEEEDKEHYLEGEECIPHQLSIIYEESEHSDAESVRQAGGAGSWCPTRTSSSMTTSEDGDSSTTLDNGDDDSDGDYSVVDSESSTVTVRLPLKLKFSRSENDEEVTTVIVGDSQVKRQEVSDTVGVPVSEEDENVKNRDKKPNLKEKEGAAKKAVEGGCTDISVTLCFPSKPNLSKRVEEWRQDTIQYTESNLTDTNSDNVIPCKSSMSNKCSKGTERTRTKISSDLPQQAILDEADIYETADSDSDVSVFLSLPLRKRSQKGPGSDSINNISEEEDEEDGKASSHCEDDSSSTTSIQTVRLTSESRGRSSGSEMENAVTADEGGEISRNKSDGSIANRRPEINILERAAENNVKSSKAQDESVRSESESENDDGSSESGKTSTSSTSCISNKEASSKKGRKNYVASLHNDDMVNEEEMDIEDNSSEESDDSQDEKEHDIIQKIYDLCDASEKVSQTDLKQRNTVTTKIKEVEHSREQKDTNTMQKSIRNEKDKQNSKSQEESEEDDSGVTSDMSRPISDADTESEAGRGEQSRLMQCQRASTHSRLFKLLQDECGKSDNEDEEDGAAMKSRREQLTLPLFNTNGSDPDSLSSSSGVTSPASPTVTDRLVKELVQSLLQRKKGRRLKKLPLAKLHAAALRILQEDMDPYDTGSSEDNSSNHAYLLPTHRRSFHHSNNTATYPMPPQQVMYGDNYYDYCDYYDSWANPTSCYGTNGCSGYESDIMPSRAFKLLSEHAQPGGFSSGIINGLWAKCPRITSSKNMPKNLTDDTDKTDLSPSSCPAPPSKSAPASARTT